MILLNGIRSSICIVGLLGTGWPGNLKPLTNLPKRDWYFLQRTMPATSSMQNHSWHICLGSPRGQDEGDSLFWHSLCFEAQPETLQATN